MAESQTSEIWRVQILGVLFMRGADVGRSPPERRPGVDRFTNYRPKLGRRPPLYRPGFARLPLVYWRAPGDFWSLVFRRATPEPRPKCDRVHPPLYRPGFARLPLVYWRAPGDFWSLVFEGQRPSPVQNVTGYISSKKYARLPGEFEIRRRSGDLQFRPEIVGYVTKA